MVRKLRHREVKMTCPRSHSQEVAELRSCYRLLGSRDIRCTLFPHCGVAFTSLSSEAP